MSLGAPVAAKIIKASRDCAYLYRRALEHEDPKGAEKCACAANNTGWMILHELGYSDKEIEDTIAAVATSKTL